MFLFEFSLAPWRTEYKDNNQLASLSYLRSNLQTIDPLGSMAEMDSRYPIHRGKFHLTHFIFKVLSTVLKLFFLNYFCKHC